MTEYLLIPFDKKDEIKKDYPIKWDVANRTSSVWRERLCKDTVQEHGLEWAKWVLEFERKRL